ncbi:transposase [Flavihumibacter stibioxidans]|uniref:Transposase IS200-like domain-containing protein n=1 Tax=Flavihumibacter stibioxidans TaxID=1834163 RepID=A0ABR7M808_9BACT|nr:transposase [Flavihumibacter stibioxidans]MBC6490964.1 hypothetical protein [Flavihumibacter stibioxidans]
MVANNGELYHIYNRGNQKQKIFFEEANYDYFLEKVEKFLMPVADILAWCLMPNHYHFMIHANNISAEIIRNRSLPICRLADSMKIIQSGYAKGFNARYDRTGNLFQQKFKSKLLDTWEGDYDINLFHYLHWNPVEAGMVSNPALWPYSSYNQYLIPGSAGLCNKQLCFDLLDLNPHSVLFNQRLAELGSKDFRI